MRKITTVVLSLCLVAAGTLAAQEAKKPLSPAAKASVEIAGKNLTVEYSAPSKRGRVIMGELVPYGKVWRTGANAATTLTTEGDLMIGTVHVPAGKYTLFTIPGEKEWTLIINKQAGQWGTNYDESKDLGRTKMVVKNLGTPVETFQIGFTPVNPNQATLTFSWENVEATARVLAH